MFINIMKNIFYYGFANLLNIYPNNVSTESQINKIREIKTNIHSGYEKDCENIYNDFSNVGNDINIAISKFQLQEME